jgi:hypothetical protein
MCKHDAEYFRRRCRALGVPEHDPFSASKFVKRGFKLQRLEQLSWPKNIFGEYASISELMAEAAEYQDRGADNTDGVCPCGCRNGGCKGNAVSDMIDWAKINQSGCAAVLLFEFVSRLQLAHVMPLPTYPGAKRV